jgi:hypothetical protein
MPTAPTTPLPPATAWQVEHLRFTVLGEVAPLDPAGAWREITGVEPEVVANQPKRGLVQVQGKLDDQRRLALQVQHRRVDWVLGPANVENLPAEGFFAISALPTALDDFSDMLNRWLPSWPSAERLALAGVMHQPQADRVAGYKQIQDYLPAITLDLESSDFLYQINRPRPSQTGIPDLRINRLTKWSVAVLTHLSGSDLTRLSEVSQRHACRLEFDINTAADFRDPLSQKSFPAILAEFAALVRELVERGDVK